MAPLIAITILFNAYIRQQHFRVAHHLPSRECMKSDLHRGQDFDFSFASRAYLQEELRDKELYPENLPIVNELGMGIEDLTTDEQRPSS